MGSFVFSFVVLAGVAKTAKLKRQMSKDLKTNCKFKEDVSLWFMGNTLDLWLGSITATVICDLYPLGIDRGTAGKGIWDYYAPAIRINHIPRGGVNSKTDSYVFKRGVRSKTHLSFLLMRELIEGLIYHSPCSTNGAQ